MSLRTFARNLRRGGRGNAPEGTTHVLAHYPPDFMEPDDHPGGFWELWTLADYRRGDHDPASGPVYGCGGPGDAYPDELAGWLRNEVLGYPVGLYRFEEELSDGQGGNWTEPAYYVTPAGGGR